MNCANHPQNAVSAYCRTCGKPLCSNCTRPVMGVIYCENCLAERVGGTAPPPTGAFQPAPGYQGSPIRPVNSGPNPALAGILGAIPFGVGAIYCGQYVKGLVYLGIFTFLVVAQSSNVPDYLHIILGFAIAFFVIYQIVDAVRTAKAIQAGQPAPDPFGLVAAFSPGAKPSATTSSYKSIPTGALVLIGLGILFLLHNLGFWFLRPGVVASLVLIAVGVWLFARRLDSSDPSCCTRGIVGPAVLVTLGAQLLLDSMDVISFGRTLPVLLIVIGVAIVIQRSSPTTSHYYPPQPPPGSPGTEDSRGSSADAAHSTEVKNG
jgi:B-box zinc finger